MCQIYVFPCYRGWKETCQATRAIWTTSRRELSSRVFFLQGKAPKEIHAILTETLGEHAPSYAAFKSWLAQVTRRDFSTCVAPHPGRLKTVTTPEIIDEFRLIVLEDRRYSTKSIAKHLGISRKRVRSIINEDLDMQKLSAKWIPKCLNADKKSQLCQSSSPEHLFDFFGYAQSKLFPLAFVVHGRNLFLSLWPGDKVTFNWVAA